MVEKKPPRMRAACGQCHSAKVKCSGEQSGCTRCAKLGLQCEYGVSMVGRASKRKNPDENEAENGAMLDVNDPSMNATPGWPQADGFQPGTDPMIFSMGSDPDLQLLPQDLLSITGLDDLSFHAFPDHHHATDHYHTHASDSGISTNPSWPAADSSPEANTSSADETSAAFTQPRNPPNKRARPYPPGFPPQPITLSEDYDRVYNPITSLEPIFIFARITQYLENQLREDDLPLDRTLTIVKGVLSEIMTNVGSGAPLLSIGCRALVFASIQDIVRLYSRAIQLHRRGATGQPEAVFKLGSFEIDPEDQQKLQNQAIAAELGRCIRHVKELSQQWGKACPNGDNCRGVHAYKGMEAGLEEMREDIESSHIKLIREELQKATVHDKKLMHPLI